MTVIVPAVVMIIAAVYAYSAVAPGAAAVPMQWSLSGKANFRVPRLFAFAVFPVIGILMVLVMNSAGAASTAIWLIALLFFAIQLLHIGLARRWYAKTKR